MTRNNESNPKEIIDLAKRRLNKILEESGNRVSGEPIRGLSDGLDLTFVPVEPIKVKNETISHRGMGLDPRRDKKRRFTVVK